MSLSRYLLLAALLLCWAAPLAAAPESDLWERWSAHDENSEASIDHGRLDAFLDRYVVVQDEGPNRVRYGQVSAADRRELDAYLDDMQAIDIAAYSRAEQRAYWINLYNAATLKLILDRYPIDSIRQIGSGLFSSGPWNLTLLRVDDTKLTLNDIEHRILRPIWADGMTHYGVNCASMSCPSLRAEAYTGNNVASALRANARAYVNSGAGVDLEDDRLVVSSIYDWYAEDFGRSDQAVISHLRRFAEPALSARLDRLDRIDGYAYDWSLNAAGGR